MKKNDSLLREFGTQHPWRENHGTFILIFAVSILLIGVVSTSFQSEPRRRSVVVTGSDGEGSSSSETDSQDGGDGTRPFPPLSPMANLGPKSRLRVRVMGLSDDAGVVRIAMYYDEGSFDANTPEKKATLQITGSEAVWEVGAPVGAMVAIKAFHDQNSDGNLGTSLLGIPNEAYGFSRGARSQRGPPPFREAAFEVTEEDSEVILQVW